MPSSVLVVDDDDPIRETLCELLTEEGYDVHHAADGRQALDRLRTGLRPCVILLDLMMPVMDGASFRAAQLEDPALKGIPVVLVTAAGHQVAMTVPAQAILHKPLNIEEVLEKVALFCRPGRPLA
jgi:CheY-like chemotaxis protein